MCWQASPKDKLILQHFFSFSNKYYSIGNRLILPLVQLRYIFGVFQQQISFISLKYSVLIWLLMGLFEGRWVDKANGPKCTPIVCKNVCVTFICKWRWLGGRGENRRTASAAHGRISHHAWLISTWYLKGMVFFLLLFESLLFDG